MDSFNILHDLPTVTEYCELRVLCGLSAKTIAAATIGLPRSLFSVILRDKNTNLLIGMARVVGDLGCSVQITDMAVHPDYRGKKLSHIIMHEIMNFIHESVPKCSFVNLFADVDFLYHKYGFISLPSCQGMYLDWTS